MNITETENTQVHFEIFKSFLDFWNVKMDNLGISGGCDMYSMLKNAYIILILVFILEDPPKN